MRNNLFMKTLIIVIFLNTEMFSRRRRMCLFHVSQNVVIAEEAANLKSAI